MSQRFRGIERKQERQQQRTTVFCFFPLSKDGAVPGRLATTVPGHHLHHRRLLFLSLDATVGAALSGIVTYDARNNSSTSIHERRRCRNGGRVIAVSHRLLRFRWRVRDGVSLLYHAASEMDELELVGSKFGKARKRLNSVRAFYATGGWRGDVGDSWGEIVPSRWLRSRPRLS